MGSSLGSLIIRGRRGGGEVEPFTFLWISRRERASRRMPVVGMKLEEEAASCWIRRTQ
jgi:hypothetical protein